MKKQKPYNYNNGKNKKLAFVSKSDLAEYKELMIYYYSMEQLTDELNSNEANYQVVMEAAVESKQNNRITNRFLCDLYNGYRMETKRSIQTVNDILEFLREYKNQKSRDIAIPTSSIIHDEQEVKKLTDELQHLYEQDEIDIGVTKANNAYEKYGSHPQILKHVFRYNMRKKEWELIRSIVDKVLKDNPSEMIQTQCYLTLFECELREANSVFKSDRTERSKKILYGKKFLNQIPKSQHNYEQYLYWYGKWYLELWHSAEGDDISNLKEAQLNFDKALAKKYTFWYHCYKCITLKLLDSKTFGHEVQKFTEYIIKEKERQPNRPAVRTYRITSFVLNDDMKGLKEFLKEHNRISSASDFQSTAFHHIELIYFYHKAKQTLYKKVLQEWIANLPVK